MLAVLGTLFGTIIGLSGSLLIERQRQRHEDSRRWDAALRELCATVVVRGEEVLRVMNHEYRLDRWPPEGNQPLAPGTAATELAALRLAVAEVRMLSEPLGEAAALLQDQLVAVYSLMAGPLPPPLDTALPLAHDKVAILRDRFVTAAREVISG